MSSFGESIVIGAAALSGVIARANRWTDETGKFSFWKAGTEILTAPAIGMMAAGVAEYFGLSYVIAGAIAAAAGLLGTSLISDVLIAGLMKRMAANE